jgi:hypothetical protein
MCDIGVQSKEGVRFTNVCVHHQLACFVHIIIFHIFLCQYLTCIVYFLSLYDHRPIQHYNLACIFVLPFLVLKFSFTRWQRSPKIHTQLHQYIVND